MQRKNKENTECAKLLRNSYTNQGNLSLLLRKGKKPFLRNKDVESFYKSKEWQKTRQSYIAYRNGLCERCYSPGVIVHHKKYITINNIHDPEITLSFNNLELLCRKCHNQEHMKEIIPYQFDEEGKLISPPQSTPIFMKNGDRREDIRIVKMQFLKRGCR